VGLLGAGQMQAPKEVETGRRPTRGWPPGRAPLGLWEHAAPAAWRRPSASLGEHRLGPGEHGAGAQLLVSPHAKDEQEKQCLC